jgi:hypothetical protein
MVTRPSLVSRRGAGNDDWYRAKERFRHRSPLFTLWRLGAPGMATGVHFNYLFVFGIVVIAAGFQGFLKGSKASLIAAGILGALILVGSQMAGTVATILALVGSLGVAGKFVPGFLKAPDKAKAIWPAGILGGMAIVAIVLIIKALL